MSSQTERGIDEMSLGKSMLTIRIIWFALLMGQVVFLAIVALFLLPHRTDPVHNQPIMVVANLIMLLSLLPVTYVLRGRIFAKSRNDDGGIRPSGYVTGNIIFWASCEGTSFFGLIVAVLTGSLWPTIVIVGISMAVQIATFPWDMEVNQ